MNPLIEKILKEFRENRPPWDWMPENLQADASSPVNPFGYKWMDKNHQIHEVTDWARIEKFLTSSLQTLESTVREEQKRKDALDHLTEIGQWQDAAEQGAAAERERLAGEIARLKETATLPMNTRTWKAGYHTALDAALARITSDKENNKV